MAFKMTGFSPFTQKEESTSILTERKNDLEIKIESIINESDDNPNKNQQNLINEYNTEINIISKKLKGRDDTNIKPIYDNEGKRIGGKKY